MGYNNINEFTTITSNEEILEVLKPVPNFTSRDDIRPWIHDKLSSRGINLVIERSDASKVVFKCKNLYRKSSTPRNTTTKIINGKQITKRIRRSIPEDSCPFRLRVSYSVKYKNWMVNIVKHEHNPALCSNHTLCGSSPIDHAQVSAANQGITSSSSKRSYYTTTNISPSPNSSIPSPYTNSPAPFSNSSNTPNEFLDYEMPFKRLKSNHHGQSQLSSAPRTTFESPLFNEIDPLDQSFLTSSNQDPTPDSLHEDLKYAYEEYSSGPLVNDNDNNNDDDDDDEFSNTLANFQFSNDSFKNYLTNSSPSSTTNASKSTPIINCPFENNNPASSSISLESQLFNDDFQIFENNPKSNSLNIKQEITTSPQLIKAIQPAPDRSITQSSQPSLPSQSIMDNDPLMYLLSSTSSNYSFEELESLDKAMGKDNNDKLLMSMFQGGI